MNPQTVMIKQQIESLLGFLEPLLNFANCHMVDFFTQGAYAEFIPKEIQKEVENVGQKEIIDFIFENNFSKAPHIGKFIENSSKFTLKSTEICLTPEAFENKLQNWGCVNLDKFKLNMFMSAKKSHEVEILSAITASISKIFDISHLVDIGDGKGYLSSMLALHHAIPVLGIDASDVNTCGAVKRANKLSKVWFGIPNAPHKSYPSKNDNTHSHNVNLYKQVTQFVNENFDLQKLISDVYLTEPPLLRLGIVGLHTCGNLSSNSLKIFTKHDYVRFICNVGCCYHLLDENSETDDFGFPMSKYLLDKKTVIGRSARMIANQSVDRILKNRELPNVTIFYRAILQVLFEQNCDQLPKKHVGKFRKQPQNFMEYARLAMERVELGVEVSDERIERLYLDYETLIDQLNIFYLLRCKLSAVIESLILLDRLLYLHEQGIENSFLVQLFDPVVSPRCYGIISIKN